MNYVLMLAGWYPNQNDLYVGDFVQRHAQAISLYHPIVVLYVTKSLSHSKTEVVTNKKGNLVEIVVYYPKVKFGNKFTSQIKFNYLAKKQIDTIIDEYGLPSLVHAYIAWKGGLMAQYVKEKFKIPYVLSDQSSAYYNNDPSFVKKFPIRFSALKKIFRNADAFISVSKIYYENCKELFGIECPCFIVENNVDTSMFYYNEKNNKLPTIVHVSTMDFPKNIEGLLRSIAALKQSHLNFKLMLIGTKHENVVQLIDTLQLTEFVEMKGLLPYAEVANHVRNSDLKILFSRYEGLPCVVLEALCCGVPVISTSVGGVPEVIDDSNGALINEGDEIALTKEIAFWLENQSKYNHKKIAEQSSAKYSFEAIGKKIFDVYLALIDIRKS